MLDEGLGVRFRALQQVQGDEAHREEVGREVRVGSEHLLRSEVTRRSHHVVGLCQAGLAQTHGDAEVGQAQAGPGRAGGLQQYVGGLDVAVDDALGVHGGEAGQQLVEQPADVGGWKGTVVIDEIDQGASGHQVHGEQDLVVVGGPAGGREYMGMVDPYGLLADEAQQGVRVTLLQNLGGHIAAAAVVPGAPDRADSPAPDRVDQFVPAGEDLTHGCASFPLRLPLWLPVGGGHGARTALRGAGSHVPGFPRGLLLASVPPVRLFRCACRLFRSLRLRLRGSRGAYRPLVHIFGLGPAAEPLPGTGPWAQFWWDW